MGEEFERALGFAGFTRIEKTSSQPSWKEKKIKDDLARLCHALGGTPRYVGTKKTIGDLLPEELIVECVFDEPKQVEIHATEESVEISVDGLVLKLPGASLLKIQELDVGGCVSSYVSRTTPSTMKVEMSGRTRRLFFSYTPETNGLSVSLSEE